MWEKQSKKIFIYNCIITGKETVLGFPVYQFVTSIFGNPRVVLFLIVVYLLLRFYYLVVEYYSLTFQINTGTLLIRKGTISRKNFVLKQSSKSEIISNVRDKTNFLQKCLKIKELQIYLNNTKNGTIQFKVLDEKQFRHLSDWLLTNEEEPRSKLVDNEEIIISKVAVGTIVATAALSANYFAVLPFLLDIKGIANRIPLQILNSVSDLPLYIIMSFVIFVFIFGSVIIQYVNFGKFQIKLKNRQIHVKNGFLDEDTNTIDILSIKGLEIYASFGMRLIGREMVSALTKNENQTSENKSKNYLLPYVKKEKTTERIYKLVGWNITKTGSWIESKPLSMVASFIPTLFVILLLMTGCYFIWFYLNIKIYMLILLGLTALLFLTRPLFTRIRVENDGFIYINQGMFNKTLYVIPHSSIEHYSYLHSERLPIYKISLFVGTSPSKKFDLIGLNLDVDGRRLKNELNKSVI